MTTTPVWVNRERKEFLELRKEIQELAARLPHQALRGNIPIETTMALAEEVVRLKAEMEEMLEDIEEFRKQQMGLECL